PGRLRSWEVDGQSAEDRLSHDACLYGPVSGVRWFGNWADHEVWIERWDIPSLKGDLETVVEMSLVKGDYFDALEVRRRLADQMLGHGWLHEQDDLKTKLVLDAFAPSCANVRVSP